METVQIMPNFILAAANMEMSKAGKASDELNRLMAIGYLNSQTGLDIANSVKTHLTKAYELLDRVDTPGVKALQCNILVTIGRQDMIIRRIELSL